MRPVSQKSRDPEYTRDPLYFPHIPFTCSSVQDPHENSRRVPADRPTCTTSGAPLKSSPWIKLLAYSARTTHEDAQLKERLAHLRETARRDRIFTELRLAVSIAIEGRLALVETADCDVTIANGDAACEFLVRVSDGCSDVGVMVVEATEHGAASRYGFGARLENRGGESDLHVMFEGDAVVPALVTGAGALQVFTTTEALSACVLAPLLDGWLS